MAVAHWPPQYGRPSKVHLAGLQHDGFVEWHTPKFIVFPKEHPQEKGGVMWDLHGQTHLMAL